MPRVEYRPEIDGLRALAVVPVIFFHAGFTGFSGGFVGVDVFFVISGFLITAIILDENAAGRFSFAGFYERRARRILPALFLVAATSAVASWFWLPPQEFKHFSGSMAAVSVFVSNVLFWATGGYFATAMELKPLLHTWSLAIEEQFYLLFPILVVILWRTGVRPLVATVLLIAAASFAASVLLTPRMFNASFFLLPTRAWELMLGALAAFLVRWRRPVGSETLSIAGIVMIVAAILLFKRGDPFPGWRASVPVAGAVLVLVYAREGTAVAKCLSMPALVGVGLISYSAYLWHQPMFAVARNGMVDDPSPLAYSLLVVATFVAAYASWRFVELPVRDRRRFSRRSVFVASALGTVTIGAAGVAGYAANGFPGRFDPATRNLLSTGMSQYEAQLRRCWSLMSSEPSIKSGCRLGSPSRPVEVALLGDSHAGAFKSVLDEHLKQGDRAGVSYTFRSCPPLLLGHPAAYSKGERECDDIRDSFFRGLAGGDVPGKVVLNARWAMLVENSPFDNGEGGRELSDGWAWQDGTGRPQAESMSDNIATSIEAILRTGREVVLIYPVPEMGWDVPARLGKIRARNGGLAPTDGSVSYASFRQRTQRAYEVLDKFKTHPRVTTILPEDALCNRIVPGRCVAHVSGTPLYYDSNHLTPAGANLVLERAPGKL